MKKLLIMILSLCMIVSLVPFAVSADANEVTDLLNAEKLTHKVNSENWEFVDGVLNAPNQSVNDAAYMTDYKIEKGQHVYVEATAKYEGLAWGIIFTESDVNSPFDRWFCINIDRDNYNSRLFCINTATGTGTPYQPQIHFPQARDGQYHTLGLEILADGSMKVYLDGEMHTVLENANFEGATVGIMTCASNATFKSFTIQEGAPTHTTVRDTAPRALEYTSTTNLLDGEILKYQAGNSQFTIADGKMTANRGGGDSGIFSDIFVQPGDHVYIEATAKITDGNAWGIMLAEASIERPFDRWICINVSVDVYKSRIFAPNAQCNVATPYEYFYYDEANVRGEEITLGMEITPDGTFYLTCNGVTYAQNKATVWNGGYVGLMTWESATEFTSATYNVVSGLKAVESTVTNNGVTLSGMMTPDIEVAVTELESGDAYNALAAEVAKLGDTTVVEAYDIAVTGGKYEGSIDVTVDLGKEYNGKKVVVLNQKSDSSIEKITAECENGKVTVTVSELSSLMIAVEDEVASTGDITTLIVLVSLASVFAAVVCLKKRQHIYNR